LQNQPKNVKHSEVIISYPHATLKKDSPFKHKSTNIAIQIDPFLTLIIYDMLKTFNISSQTLMSQ